MPGDEQCRFLRLRCARERMLLHHLAGTGQQHRRHAVVRSDRTAVMQRLHPTLLDAWKTPLPLRAQAQLAWNNLFCEIAVTDEQRNDEHPRREHPAHHRTDRRLLLPETLCHLAKDLSTAQLIRMLVSGCG